MPRSVHRRAPGQDAALRLAAALVFVVLASASGSAADRRVVVDPNASPWNAIVKVQTNTGGRCTGVLIAPSVVLTAAHCLYNPRTRALLQPISLHVLFGYERAGYRWHRPVTRLTIGRGFAGAAGAPQSSVLASDWARLDLGEAVPVPPLPLFEGGVSAGMAVALAGYNQDRAQLLTADLACHVLHATVLAGRAIALTHDCAATHGTSGAPLLARQNGGWAVVGVNIAAGSGANLALAAPFGD